MPLHDWSRAEAGAFQSFSTVWIVEILRVLKRGLLPEGYEAIPERHAFGIVPDVLTFQKSSRKPLPSPRHGPSNEAVSTPPKFDARRDRRVKPPLQRMLAIRDTSHHRLVAVVEIVSPGDKDRGHAARNFVRKTAELLARGIHLLLLDLHPPGRRDPEGLHNRVWRELTAGAAPLPFGPCANLTAFDAGDGKIGGFVVPVDIGHALPAMPLFLEPGLHVDVPLEGTYMSSLDLLPPETPEPFDLSA